MKGFGFVSNGIVKCSFQDNIYDFFLLLLKIMQKVMRKCTKQHMDKDLCRFNTFSSFRLKELVAK